MTNLNEVAPQNVELLNSDESLAKYGLNSNKPFNFDIKIIDELVKIVDKTTVASYIQIMPKVLQNLGIIDKFAGINDIMDFWVADVSNTGKGKGSCRKITDLLMIQPVKNEIRELKARYDKEFKALKASAKKNGEDMKREKWFKIEHDIDFCSKEGFCQALKTLSLAYINGSEMGLMLGDKGNQPIISSLVKTFGEGLYNQPTQKINYDESENDGLSIDNINIFFYIDSNLAYLGKNIFIKHIRGGLFNRALLYFGDKKIKEPPLNVTAKEKNDFYERFNEYLNFCKKYSQIKLEENYIQNHQIYKEFWLWRDEKRESVKEPYSDLFVRFDYFFLSIAIILHWASEFERFKNTKSFKPTTTIDSDVLRKTADFLKLYAELYDDMIDKIEGNNNDNSFDDDKFLKRIINVLARKIEKEGFCYISQLNKLTRTEFRANEIFEIIKPYVEIEDKKIIKILKENLKDPKH